MPQRTFETMGKPAVPSRYAMVEPPCVWCYSIQRIQHRQISWAVSSHESGNDIQVNLQQDPDSICSPNCNIHLGLPPAGAPEPIPRSGCDPRRRCQMRFPRLFRQVWFLHTHEVGIRKDLRLPIGTGKITSVYAHYVIINVNFVV